MTSAVDAGRHAEVLRVVARAELHRVHEQARDGEVAPFGARRRPARLPQQHHRREAGEAEGEAQREEREGRRVVQPDLRRDVPAPHTATKYQARSASLRRRRLQGGDARLDRRMGGEQLRPAATRSVMPNALTESRQAAGLQAAQAAQRGDHRLRRAEQVGRAGVGAELALAREPGDDHRGEDAEHDLRRRSR